MNRLDDRLRGLDEVGVPDVWRMARDRGPQRPVEPQKGVHRVVAVTASVAIALGSFVILQQAFREGGETRRPTNSAIGTIAFVTQGQMQPEIAIVRADGSGLTLLAVGQNPAWSPDGQQLAFDRSTARGTGIFLMAADGSGVTRLTRNVDGVDEEPTWSPDGTRIAFTRSVGIGEPRDVFVLTLQGGGIRRLTAPVSDDFSPSWSPDGSRIAFIRVPEGIVESATGAPGRMNQVWTMAADGGEQERVTEMPGGAWRPAWSPGGDVIAFDAGGAIWFVHPDGSGLVQLDATKPFGGFFASWSQDGGSLLFGGHEAGKANGNVVFETDLASGEPRIVLNLPGGASSPALRPTTSERAPSGEQLGQPCEPDVAGTWGTRVAPWLTSVLVNVVSPDGQPLSEADIHDTGSALQIGGARSEVVLYAYASVPDLEHDPRPSMVRTGSIGYYDLYAGGNGKVRQYGAFGPGTWLSLSAYATTPATATRWAAKTDVHAWLKAVIGQIAADPLPSC
ncbi:MAG: hypothetical protein ABI635_07525 [Actinomycetota bacterium]